MRRIALVLLIATAPHLAYAAQAVTNQGVSMSSVTKSDATVINPPTKAILIGDAAACNIALILQNDTAAVTLTNIQPGQILPLQAKKVMSTNTTCATIIAIF